MSTEPLPGADRPTTDYGRAVAARPQFPDGRYKGPRSHVAVNGYDIAAIEAEAVDAYLASPEAAEELARALAVIGAEYDPAGLPLAPVVLTALRKERETLGS